MLINFLLSVIAGIAANFAYNWLIGKFNKDNGNEPK